MPPSPAGMDPAGHTPLGGVTDLRKMPGPNDYPPPADCCAEIEAGSLVVNVSEDPSLGGCIGGRLRTQGNQRTGDLFIEVAP